MSKFNKKYIAEIEKYFQAPTPKGKSDFLDKTYRNYIAKNWKKEDMTHSRLSILYMIFVQFSYISKWLWIFSILISIFMFVISIYIPESLLWSVFAVIPFIVTFSLSESMRSIVYGMGEFEMTSRFSLKSIIMSRLLVLGIGNMILLFVLAWFNGDGMWKNVAYMLAPYLLSATGGLVILRKFTSKEGVYMSCTFSVIISVLCLTGINSFSFIYEAKYTCIWIIATIVLFINAVYESYKTADIIGSGI